MRPRVSVGMPVYNGERFLAAAIESILSQTFTDFELILSDNASTDSTEHICRRYAAADKRVRYFRNHANLGAARNFNRVYRAASGEYFKWAAHDDLCLADYLSRCVEVLDHDPSVVLCHPRVKTIDENGNVMRIRTAALNGHANQPHMRFRDLVVIQHGCYAVFGLIRSAALSNTRLIGSYLSSDRVLLAELSLQGRFVEIPQCLFVRREHPGVSMRVNKNYGQRAAWFDPRLEGRILLPAWRLCFEYVRALGRVSVSPVTKLLCYGHILHWIRSRRKVLARQLSYAARKIARKELLAR